ncbi:MAG: squalene synthase HpnC [Acidobacteriota bacterium]
MSAVFRAVFYRHDTQVALTVSVCFFYNPPFKPTPMTTSIRQNRIALATAIDAPRLKTKTWSLDEAYDYCEKLARSHYENFPVGSVLVPKPLRKYFYSIYAFARIADDFADEGYEENYSAAARLELIEEWRVMLGEAFAGRAWHPVFVALADTQKQFALPLTLFEDLLSAFAQDVEKRRYQTFTELADYCRRSANPIGRLILLLFGYRDARLHEMSDAICTGLQLANHWQDVAIDLGKDRVYLPEADLRRFGLSYEGLNTRTLSKEFCELMQFEITRARELFNEGKALCTTVTGRLGIELRVVWLGGTKILKAIEENGYDVFRFRPMITKRDKLQILIKALRKEAFKRD